MQRHFLLNKRFLFVLPLALFNLIAKTSQANTENELICPSTLPEKINSILANSDETSRWGIKIQPWSSQQVLYQQNADKFFIPASTVKLFTTATALKQFNPKFQIKTPVYRQGKPPHLETLKIIGEGDPSLKSTDLEKLAQILNEKGVRSIEKIVLKTDKFAAFPINSTWEWEDVYAAYGTAATNLILDENSVTLTLTPQGIGESVETNWNNAIAASQWKVKNEAITAPANTDYQVQLQGKLGTSQLQLSGKLPQHIQTDVWHLAIAQPNHYFRDTLLTKLGEAGIAVNQIQLSDSVAVKGEKIMEFASPPLTELIQTMNRNSNNLYAESLLKQVRASMPGATANMAVFQQALTPLGISPEAYRLVDGSGLSRRNLVTPSAIAQLLQSMLKTDQAEIFRSSLAVAGVNGTLENRLQSTPLQGKLQGKTGTLTGISAFSGYVELPHYQPLIFTIILNHSKLSSSQQREMIDQILLQLSHLKEC
ncbi:MAG: D-alanyl-D-alanine carboxypeptidase/D-alanyl-D-alanine-endopeptidase [Cyanobacteria bacterium SW_9_44_58]|nr:MAG: D-alanyl-D-alanine carboxypeptidase/D-alanyl-D-alanine-endopeptidase [Cyanobacteria bacterium SW_9_44_58]